MVGQIRAAEICLRVRELSKIPKRGWNRTEGKGHKDFTKEDKLGQAMCDLKIGRTGTPLRTMIK